MRRSNNFVTPFVLPVAAFLATIFLGGGLLSMRACATGDAVPFVDALFIATSAVSVTGLAPFDVFTVYNRFGQCVLLALVQLGGIGIVTYTTLVLYMLRQRISLRDRVAVTQGLLYNPNFKLGRFLQHMVLSVLLFETIGAMLLFCMEPERIGLYHAIFLAVSAFCNAGFTPWPDNLAPWKDSIGVTSTIMALIVIGGLGFFVINDLWRVGWAKLNGLYTKEKRSSSAVVALPRARFSFYTRVAVSTSFLLLFGGAAAIFAIESANGVWADTPMSELLLNALFQSVTSRTAGFATVDLALYSDVTLLLTIFLMFIGGSPGSCAGGVKTTSFRILWASITAHLRGHQQVVVAGRAIDSPTLNKLVLLLTFSLLTVIIATSALTLTENGFSPHQEAWASFMDLLFEVVSAFATVGLSVNMTPHFSAPGKLILCVVMFIGKLGPIWLISTVQQLQTEAAFRYAEDSLPIG